uniref:Uncharacterized protein n=1 Tax=Zea mays TaxID=4577 RepID=A0A804QIX7_MAIZE
LVVIAVVRTEGGEVALSRLRQPQLLGRLPGLERLSIGFGGCTLHRVDSHSLTASPQAAKPKAADALGYQGVGEEHEQDQHHRVKCVEFFGGCLGTAAPPSSSYWLSAPNDKNGGSTRGTGSWSHWS